VAAYEPPGRGDLEERPPNEYGIRHIELDMVGIEAEYERLSAAGMRFVRPPQRSLGVYKAIYGRDPDGNILELRRFSTRTIPPCSGEPDSLPTVR
jgi:catechol 2,3-dioxygenase-like lactoylglutathione lyase family enzyme